MTDEHMEAVTQLVLRERQSRDRGWWADWSSCFADDSVVDMSWFTGSGAEFVRETRLRFSKGAWGRHRVSPPTVRITNDRAWAELPLAIEFHPTIFGVEADLVSYCRSQYRAERADGIWRITRITSIYERDTLSPAIPGTTLALEGSQFAGYRPSYHCLAWYLDQNGSQISSDLPGDDQPATTAAVYAAEHAWLNAITTSDTRSARSINHV